MSRILQVGVGSGGMVVLDLLSRDEHVTGFTLIEPDVYQPHNVVRHHFPPGAAGKSKLELAAGWLRERRPELEIELIAEDLTAPTAQDRIEAAAAACDLGVCAVDNEHAKRHWDALMRRCGKPWTLGEVLSGGIGGFVHRFTPGGPCYGCVASHLKREATVDQPPTPDYSAPGGPVHEVTIPAAAAAIHAVASLHALVTLEMLEPATEPNPDGWSSLLLTLKAVRGVFEQAYRPYRFAIPRLADCLDCRAPNLELPAEALDAAVAQALERLGHP